MPGTQGHGPQIKELEIAARALSLELRLAEVRGSNELESAFSAMTTGRAGAFISLQLPTLDRLRERIVDLRGQEPAASDVSKQRICRDGRTHVLCG